MSMQGEENANEQVTLGMIKPHITNEQMNEIIIQIEKSGLELKDTSRITFTQDLVDGFYPQCKGKPYHAAHSKYIMQGPCTFFRVYGKNAVNKLRSMQGPTKKEESDKMPNTIRGKYSLNTTENGFHASETIEDAQWEWKFLSDFLSKQNQNDDSKVIVAKENDAQ